MSLPSSPARSWTHSAASTPSAAPQELTPRSKVKALLAAIDDDDSNAESPHEKRVQPRSLLSAIPGNARKSVTPQYIRLGKHLLQENQELTEDDDEDADSPFIPRGRVAKRLKRSDIESPVSSEGKIGHEDAYSRIKKKLALQEEKDDRPPPSKSKQSETLQTNSTSPTGSTGVASDHGLGRPLDASESRRSSPGLFVTPEKRSGKEVLSQEAATSDGSESELPADPHRNKRFLELVAKKKAEREAKQVAEDQERKEKMAQQRSFEKELSKDDWSDDEEPANRKLTQHTRPTRKASKKALEEMNRETQRMSRNMQLAHQAKTKKKVTKDSLFARFNFRTSANSNGEVHPNLSSSTNASSLPVSDAEQLLVKSTPPTSPMDADHSPKVSGEQGNAQDTLSLNVEQDELPSMLEIMSQPLAYSDKGKGKAVDDIGERPALDLQGRKKTELKQRPVRVRMPESTAQKQDINLDSDDEIEVIPIQKGRSSKRDVFDRLPSGKAQEGHSLQTLRTLAHLNSPDRKMRGKKTSTSLADMQTTLQKRARQQAVDERAAKIEELKSRGIYVQSAEERQQDQVEVENLLEKARREGEEIMQKERRAAKKAKIEAGEVDDLPDSSDEDEDYREEHGDEPELELSGSDEEDGEVEGSHGSESEADDSNNDDDAEGGVRLDGDDAQTNHLIDNEASEDGDDERDDVEIDGDDEDDDELFKEPFERSRRKKAIIDDEEDDDDSTPSTHLSTQEVAPAIQAPVFPTGPSNLNAVPMGLTQAFAATMADTQTQAFDENDEQDSMALLETVPEPDFSLHDSYDSLQLIADSQGGPQAETNTSKEIDLHFSQSQIRYDALADTFDQSMATQVSEIPDPTQDAGFGMSSPVPERILSIPPSTVDTVLLPGAFAADSPARKRGRLRRRVSMERKSSDSDEDVIKTNHEELEDDETPNAFEAMRKARRAAAAAAAKEAFDKKKSEAKTMVEEQAQESEDEYAGLGGASDEDSGEEDADVNAMMDHGEVNVDERRLAQLYA